MENLKLLYVEKSSVALMLHQKSPESGGVCSVQFLGSVWSLIPSYQRVFFVLPLTSFLASLVS